MFFLNGKRSSEFVVIFRLVYSIWSKPECPSETEHTSSSWGLTNKCSMEAGHVQGYLTSHAHRPEPTRMLGAEPEVRSGAALDACIYVCMNLSPRLGASEMERTVQHSGCKPQGPREADMWSPVGWGQILTVENIQRMFHREQWENPPSSSCLSLMVCLEASEVNTLCLSLLRYWSVRQGWGHQHPGCCWGDVAGGWDHSTLA